MAPFAAAQQSNGCEDLSGTPVHVRVDWQLEVKPILAERCVGCHNHQQLAGGLDLSDVGIDAIYKLLSSGRVLPAQPGDSVLFQKINCAQPPSGGDRMPDGGDPLTRLQQELIHDWIAQGAYGEPDAPIEREFVFRDGLEALR